MYVLINCCLFVLVAFLLLLERSEALYCVHWEVLKYGYGRSMDVYWEEALVSRTMNLTFAMMTHEGGVMSPFCCCSDPIR